MTIFYFICGASVLALGIRSYSYCSMFSPLHNYNRSMAKLQKLGVRSIILTSGTLSPLQATAEEIGLKFPVQLENKHIVSSSQVWCGVLGTGPGIDQSEAS